MPPKRPAPLSDAAIGHKGGTAVLGETNAGVPLPVKNTFIDVPSGLTPESAAGKKIVPLKTAPAQLDEPGFIQRMVASALPPALEESNAEAVPEPPQEAPPAEPAAAEAAAAVKAQSATLRAPPPTGSPKKGAAAAVQRPGMLGEGAWPLMTPSPTGTMFSTARYQLFGGPAPVQEATSAALCTAPGAGQQSALPAAGPPGAAPPSKLEPVGQEEDEDEDDSDDGQPRVAQGKCPDDAPKPPPGAEHPSIGSESHKDGTCKRCCFFPRNRCQNGYNCEFCHYEHEKRKRKNKKSKKKNKEGAEAAATDGAAPAAGDAVPSLAAAPAGAASAAELEAHMWQQAAAAAALPPADPLYSHMPPAAPIVPQVTYESVEGIPQWTYQWIDAPRQFPVPSAAEATASYFAAATGLQATVPGADQVHMPPQLSTQPPAAAAGQPPYMPPAVPYPGVDPLAQQWPGAYGYQAAVDPAGTAAAAALAADAAWQSPPCAPPASYPPLRPELNGVAPVAAAAPLVDTTVTSAMPGPPPPMEAPSFEPTLPHELKQSGEELSPPPMGHPTLPVTVDTQQGAADSTPPPPMSSPKLPSNLLMSLQQEPPPVPGQLPA